MPYGRYKTMSISEDNLNRLNRFWEKNEEALSSNGVNSLNDLVGYFLNQAEHKKIEKRLEHINVYEDHITIRDNQLKQEINVYVRDKVLWCEYDQSENCIHVGYAWAIPKVVNALKPTF